MVDLNRPHPWTVGIAGAILAACYLLVLYWMQHPNVSDAYRAYYIDRSTSLTLFEQGKLARDLHQPIKSIVYNDPTARFSGWSASEDGFRWNKSKEPFIEFTLEQNVEPRGVMVISARYLGQQRVTVVLNGVEVTSYDSREVQKDLIIDLPAGLLRAGEVNTLQLRLPNAVRPGAADTRLLALALISLEVY